MRMDPDPRAARLIRKAATYVDKHGFCRGMLGSHGDARCMIGALRSATGIESVDSVLRLKPWIVLVTSTDSLPVFNDCECRDKYDVIAALTIAADIAETGWDLELE